MSSENRNTVIQFYEALARADHDAVLAMLNDNVECRAAEKFIYADQNPYVGPAAVSGLMKRIAADWSKFEMIPDEIHGAGDMVIACGRYIGVYKANGFNLLAEFVHVFKFKDGKIISQHNYTDTAQFRDALNQAPAMQMPGNQVPAGI
ncbi:MAG: nuclear transport factor 2 family protein [Acidobacteriota bacterium]